MQYESALPSCPHFNPPRHNTYLILLQLAIPQSSILGLLGWMDVPALNHIMMENNQDNKVWLF